MKNEFALPRALEKGELGEGERREMDDDHRTRLRARALQIEVSIISRVGCAEKGLPFPSLFPPDGIINQASPVSGVVPSAISCSRDAAGQFVVTLID